MAAAVADAVVIGGGALGCAIAWRLAQAGLAVTLAERGEPGGEASSAAAGILGAQMESHGPGPLLQLQLASRALHPALADELRELTGLDVHCRIEGVLEQAFTEHEAAELRARFEWQREAGLRVEWFEPRSHGIDITNPYELLRGLAPGAHAALLLADDGQVDNRRLSRALHLAAERAGVAFIRADATQVLAHGAERSDAGARGGVSGVALRGAQGERIISTPRVVVAAGSWSALVPGSRIAANAVRPVRGQMLAVALPAGEASLGDLGARVLSCSSGYAVPRHDRVFVGATVEETGFEKGVTERGLASLRATLARLLPALADAPIVERWSGLRPASRDGLPLLGAPANGPDGLFVCSGHYRSGILLTPLSAELLRDAVLGRAPRFELAPFRPDRFAP